MAVIYEALEKLDNDDGRSIGWHYCARSDETAGSAYPIGRCSTHEPHPTYEEARECGFQSDLDNANFDASEPNVQRTCATCGTWTTRRVTTRWHITPLCDEHANRACLEAHLRKGRKP